MAPLSLEAQARLQAYAWPGNLRELQNVVERGVIVSEHGSFDIDRVLPTSRPKARRALKAEPAESVLTVAEMAELERSNILRALERTGWKVSGKDGAAALLQMNPSTLNSRMRALCIRRP